MLVGAGSINFRINVWAVREMILAPIIGIGPGHDAFNKIYPLYQRTRRVKRLLYFLLKLLETGFIGLSCFLWLLLVTCSQGWLQLQQLRRLRSEGFWLMGAISALQVC